MWSGDYSCARESDKPGEHSQFQRHLERNCYSLHSTSVGREWKGLNIVLWVLSARFEEHFPTECQEHDLLAICDNLEEHEGKEWRNCW